MIRESHPDEVTDFARQWSSAMIRPAETRQVDDLGPFVQLGPKRGHGVHRRFLSAGLDAVCTFELARSTIAVLDVDGVALGWVAFDAPDVHPLTIKFLLVADLVRRRGFGSTLLRHALGHRDGRTPRLTCITSSGAALYRAVAAPALSPGEHASAAEYSRVVEARG